jgi:hypothetical protein
MKGGLKLVFGVGLNDADYPVTKRVTYGGTLKYSRCKFYITWNNMLKRCYSEEYKLVRSSYKDCKVCDEWLTFSNFKAWMERQDWQGKFLDKDIILIGNKLYSPDRCLFVEPMISSFFNGDINTQKRHKTGVYYDKKGKAFKSECSNPFLNKKEFIGRFSCIELATASWRNRKHELACQLADLQTDKRVAQALRSRYA